MEKRKMYRPVYVRDFMCIGGACSNNCCNGWTVTIDEETFHKYKKLKDIYRKTILRNIKTEPQPNGGNMIIMDKNRNCPLREEDGLCGIQKRFGHDYLSVTCQIYPRILLDAGDSIEEYLVPSCPEAARVIMQNPDYIDFEEDIGSVVKYTIGVTPDCRGYINSDNGYDIFWILRKMCVSILQFRKYELWQRFVILGFFLELVSEKLPGITKKDASDIADAFSEQLEQGIYDNLVSQLPVNNDLKALFIQSGLNFIDYKKNAIFEAAREGLGLNTPDMDAGLLIKGYNEAYNIYYKSFFGDKEYLLENYFVNTILCRAFPFGVPADSQMRGVMNNYAVVTIKFGIIKNLLVGLCGYHKENFGYEILYNAISIISRAFEHNIRFNEKMMKLLPENGSGLVSALSMMIRE